MSFFTVSLLFVYDKASILLINGFQAFMSFMSFMLSIDHLHPPGSGRKVRTLGSHSILWLSSWAGLAWAIVRGFSLNSLQCRALRHWVACEGMEQEMPLGSVIARDFTLVLFSPYSLASIAVMGILHSSCGKHMCYPGSFLHVDAYLRPGYLQHDIIHMPDTMKKSNPQHTFLL